MDAQYVSGERIRSDGVAGTLFEGLGDGPHPGVLVLHGAGGAGGYEQSYAALLAEHGYTALCVEYFGAPGIRDALLEVPLEEFGRAVAWLRDRPDVAGDAVGVVGFSRGGEAALAVGAHVETVGCVVAYVPSGYVWPAPSWMDGVGEDEPAWTLDGEPIEHHPIDAYVRPDDGLGDTLGGPGPSACTLALERSTPEEQGRAEIPVERIDGPVLLVSGGDDAVWPSGRLATVAHERLREHDHAWRSEHLSFSDAGHAIRVPYRFDGQTPPDGTHEYGGTHAANARAAARAWEATLAYLRSSPVGG